VELPAENAPAEETPNFGGGEPSAEQPIQPPQATLPQEAPAPSVEVSSPPPTGVAFTGQSLLEEQ
jgi:hypothetical protein